MRHALSDWFTGVADGLARRSIRSKRERLFLFLAVAVRGGMTPADAVAAMGEREDELARPAYSRTYREIEARLRDGEHTLAEALADVVRPDDLCFLAAEHKVLDVAEIFQMAYDAAVRRKEVVAAVTKPFYFPLYLGILALGVLVLGGTVMLPNFVEVLPQEYWEAATRLVYRVGRVLRDHTVLVSAGLAALLVWMYWSLPNLATRLRTDYLDKIFPWSLYRTVQSSGFLVNMAALFRSKVPVLDAVNTYASVARPYEAGYLERMRTSLESEQTSSDMRALDVGFIDLETMSSMVVLNVKLPPEEIIQRIGESEMQLLLEDVKAAAERIARGITVSFALVLVVGIYGTFAIVPTLSEKVSEVHGARAKGPSKTLPTQPR